MDIRRNPAGLILSAGYSSRMNDFKPLMKIGNSCPLGILIENMKTAGINDIFVVAGHNADLIEEFVKDKDVTLVRNPDYADGMFTSVKKGVDAAFRNGNDCFLMNPVDVPLVPPYIFKALINRFYRSDRCRFAVACYMGQKAHPLLIPAEFSGEIMTSDGPMGMKSVTSLHASSMMRVDTHCESITMDMDTQEDYRKLTEFYETHKYPDKEQCQRILDRVGTPAHIVKHCQAVTDTALTIAMELNYNGLNMSLPLIYASGSLHDVLRMRPDHPRLGAELLLDYGYPEVADIIKDHMKYQHPLPVYDITEKDVICLSDKLRQEDKLVTLEQRLAPVLLRWKDDPEAVRDIESKIGCTYAVMNYINVKIGRNVYDLLREHDSEQKNSDDAAENKVLKRIVLIRHGETEKHAEKIFLGKTDVPLSDEGKRQCRIVGIELQHFDIDSPVIFCSDLRRARESAEIIASNMEGSFTIIDIPEFEEMNLGSWDGIPIREIREKHPAEYEKRGQDLLGFRIDGASENFYDLRARVLKKFNEIVQEQPGDVVIVSHSGVLRVLKCELSGRPLSDVTRLKFDRGTYELLDLTQEYADRYKLEVSQ
ncbi:MAG: histidine phosphatase family protein [Eubacteriales bacterium]|nr:histidine phosphatase family protein [Eubacteriales bacterium]